MRAEKLGALQPIVELFRRSDTRRLGAVMVLNGLGIEIAKVVRDTFFINVAGAQYIPYVYIVFAAVMVASSILYAHAARRFSVRHLSSFAAGCSAIFAVGAWYGIFSGFTSLGFAATVFVVVEMFFIFVPLTVWAIANESFGLQEGERFLPSLTSCALLGTVFGGVLSRVLTNQIGPYNLLLLSAVAFTLVAILVAQMISNTCELAGTKKDSHSGIPSLNAIWHEPIIRTLSLLALPLWVLAYLVEYTYFYSMESVFSSPVEFSEFLSSFLTVCSLAALFIQIYITPYLVRRIGAAATCFTYPAALACATTALLVYGLYPGAQEREGYISFAIVCVLVARFLDMSLYQSIYESSVQMLYYAVSVEARVKARAFLGGIVFPLSIACAGVILAFFRYFNEPIYNVTFSAVVVGFLVLILAMDIRPDYLRSLLGNAHKNSGINHDGLHDAILDLPLSEARSILLDELYTEDKERIAFALSELKKQIDEAFLEELQDRSQPLAEEVIQELTEELPPAFAQQIREICSQNSKA
jgi:ATP/ADP translocase